MNTIVKIILACTLMSSIALASSAAPGVKVFKQADGSTFEGILKGNAFFNWIESNGNVVMYNAQDKSYYKAIYDEQKGFVLSSTKISSVVGKSSADGVSSAVSDHKVSKSIQNQLAKVYEANRKKFEEH